MVATGILPQATLARPCASRLFARLEYEQKSCAYFGFYFIPIPNN
jgi:hypothetical protein